jgi:serine protease Do/serine protease DegQ
MARSIMDQLIEFGSVKRGLLGVNIFSLTPDMAKSLSIPHTEGVLVSQVTEGSAAAKAGIKPGDVITRINGQTIKSHSGLRNAIGLSRVGEKLEVTLIRDRKTMQVTAVITELPVTTRTPSSGIEPSDDAGTGLIHPGLEGATLADAPGGGVEIRAVEQRSVAAAWFRKGDRIGESIANPLAASRNCGQSPGVAARWCSGSGAATQT